MKEFLHRFSGFPACDGVGSTLRRLAAFFSLQRPFLEQVLTPKQLFEFANSEITGVTIFFVNSQSINKEIKKKCSIFKGTCKNHEIIPGGQNIVMNCASGVASKNLLIQQNESVFSIEYIMPGLF